MSPSRIDGVEAIVRQRCTSRREWEAVLDSPLFAEHQAVLELLTELNRDQDRFSVVGYCWPCGSARSFNVPIERFSVTSRPRPAWREGLRCASCRMNNRKRAMCWFAQAVALRRGDVRLYMTEQVTPLYAWLDAHVDDVVGSEFLGHELSPGAVVEGRRHEDVENLSFESGEFDLVVSLDVLEHVNDPSRALSELHRVLKDGGELLLTVPFSPVQDRNERRAIVRDGRLEHLRDPVFHGNPLSAQGSLVFTDFGWELLEELQSLFRRAELVLFHSLHYGHLGPNLSYFHCRR